MTRLAKTKKTPYDTIKCPNKYCDNVSSPLYLVEEVVIESLNNWLVGFKAKWEDKRLDSPYGKLISEKQSLIEQQKANLDKLYEQKERIHSLLEQGVYSVEIFTKRNQKIIDEIESLKMSIKNSNKELDSLKLQSEYNDVFIPNAENILDIYYDLDSAAERNEVLKEVLARIEYVKDEPNKWGDRNNKNFIISLDPRILKF